jgi:hypothetical protein
VSFLADAFDQLIGREAGFPGALLDLGCQLPHRANAWGQQHDPVEIDERERVPVLKAIAFARPNRERDGPATSDLKDLALHRSQNTGNLNFGQRAEARSRA